MKTLPFILFTFLQLALVMSCRSSQRTDSQKQPKLSQDEFFELDWQRQVEYLESVTSSNLVRGDKEIISAALSDDDSAVVIAALE